MQILIQIYKIRVTCPSSLLGVWYIHRRYSDFWTLRKTLLKVLHYITTQKVVRFQCSICQITKDSRFHILWFSVFIYRYADISFYCFFCLTLNLNILQEFPCVSGFAFPPKRYVGSNLDPTFLGRRLSCLQVFLSSGEYLN